MATVYAKTHLLENDSLSFAQHQAYIPAPGIQTTARREVAASTSGPNPTTYMEDVMVQTIVNTPAKESNTTYRALSGGAVTVDELYERLTRVYEIKSGLTTLVGQLPDSPAVTSEDAGILRIVLFALDGLIKEIDAIYPDPDPVEA